LEKTETKLKAFEIYYELSRVYLLRKEWGKALSAAKRVLSIAENSKEDIKIALSLIVLGNVYASGLTAETDDPRPYFERGAALIESASPGSFNQGVVLRDYGIYLIGSGEPVTGESYLRAAQNIFERLGAQGELAKIARVIPA
jgi:Tfp pilus assembly protein PilF